MRANGVPTAAIADAVAERIDVLLERATDSVIGAPRPGSPQWYQEWESRGSASGRAAYEQRMLVKIAIAARAGVDPCHEIDRAHRAGVPWPGIAGAAGTGTAGVRRPREPVPHPPRAGGQQLAIW
jgi:hypothetical protein